MIGSIKSVGLRSSPVPPASSNTSLSMQMTDTDEEQLHKTIAREIYQMISAFSCIKK